MTPRCCRALADVDAAVINTNYAFSAGLYPNTDAIYVEQDSPYVNVIVVRAGNEKPAGNTEAR